MKRVSSLTLSLLIPLVAFACSSEPDTGDTNNPPNTTAGTGNPAAGTGNTTPTAGASAGGTPGTAGTGGAATAGASTGGAGASAGGTGGASGGTGGAATGGGGAATGGGGAATGGGGGGGTGGTNAACPMKIDSAVMCTQIITCPNATCGVFKLGAKNCDCAAATGPFKCTSCDYTGKTESIVVKPAAALPACTADDATLEGTASGMCTSGDRCKSTTVDKDRFCACWTDAAKGGTVWDCDATPKSWTTP